MMGPKASSLLKLLLVVDDSPSAMAAVELLTRVSWPAWTSIHILARVPGYLPQMEAPAKSHSALDEAVELSRWRDWAIAKSLVTRVAHPLRAHNLAVETGIYEGELAEIVLERSTTLSANLIVVGTPVLEASGKLQPDLVVWKLLEEANCPVLVTRPTAQVRPLSVILAVDDSTLAWQAVKFLRPLSLSDWARVTVVSVIPEKEKILDGPGLAEPVGLMNPPKSLRNPAFSYPEARATEAVKYLREGGAQSREAVRFGQPADEILETAREREAALIVLGATGRVQPKSAPLGSVAQKVVQEASCSVLIVR